MRKKRLASKNNRLGRRAVVMFIVSLLAIMLTAGTSFGLPTFTVFVTSDFSQTEGIGGWEFTPGSQVTLDIDYEPDGTFDFTYTTVVNSNGDVGFSAQDLGFSVQEGSFVRLSDDQSPQIEKTHIVEYMTLTDVDAAADTVSGTAREDTELYVRAIDPSLPFPQGEQIKVIGDATENWSVDFSPIPFEIGQEGWVQTIDGDGDHTQINWYVDVFNTDTGEGFDTIQDAIDDADTLNGHTIEVRDGTYNENVNVNKGLTIRAMEYGNPIVNGSGSGSCFNIYKSGGLDNVTIDGFEIRNADRGIWIYGDPSTYNNVTISNNHIHDQFDNGILVTDATVNGLTISGNTVSVGCSSGQIGISFANNTTVNGLTIDRNDISWNCAGLYLLDKEFHNVTVTNCIFDGNEWEHIALGVTWTGSATISNVEISNCQFYTHNNWCDVYITATFAEMLNGDYNVRINYNEFFAGTQNYGVFNNTTVTVNGIANWWGDTSGPYNPWDTDSLDQLNPDGLGDIVTEYVLYDPWIGKGGFVTGGGTIWSDINDFVWNPSAEGQATFGFVSMYKKGAQVPEGHTNFVFQAGSLHFQSSEYDWLVVAGDTAMFKGTGTIDGAQGNYKFMLWAGDNDPDTFRIRIWEEVDGEDVVYDNGDHDPITSGNIFIHKYKKK